MIRNILNNINNLFYSSNKRLIPGTSVYFSFNHHLVKGVINKIIDETYYKVSFYDNSWVYPARYYKDDELFLNKRDAEYHCLLI